MSTKCHTLATELLCSQLFKLLMLTKKYIHLFRKMNKDFLWLKLATHDPIWRHSRSEVLSVAGWL